MSPETVASHEDLQERLGGRALLLFDGQCGFCHNSVRWVMRRDRNDRFRFAPQQSALAATVFDRHGIHQAAMLKSNSVYMALEGGTDHERLLRQSDVTVDILLRLGGGWRLLGYLLRAVPTFLRDAAYRLVAHNRYRLSSSLGARVCPGPSAAERTKFID
jgi:predicted DCC family thiol-disulfide oxidoreductase YuxK